jgi:hypothetical protein
MVPPWNSVWWMRDIFWFQAIHNKKFFFSLRTFPHYWVFSSTIQVSWSHTIDTYGRTPLNDDQPVAEASTYTGQHNIETQETNTHAISVIRTRDPSNQAAADLRLRPRGYRGRLLIKFTMLNLYDSMYRYYISTRCNQPNVVAELTLLLRYRAVPGFKFRPGDRLCWGFSWFSQSLHADAGTVL